MEDRRADGDPPPALLQVLVFAALSDAEAASLRPEMP
jgi:hypothetical protein